MGDEHAAVAVPTHVLDYLQSQHTLTLATATPEGVPHAVTLTFANDGTVLYCWTSPEALTVRHLDRNPAISFAIAEYAPDWRQTKGLQGAGRAQVILDPAEIKHVVALFERKFPHLANSSTRNLAFLRITPAELRFIDSAVAGDDRPRQQLGLDYRQQVVYSVFTDLPHRAVDTLATRLDTVRVEPGAVIVRQGAPADKFFIIVEGAVEVLREEDGASRPLATLRGGQFFGEMAILRDIPRTATVRAVAPTTLLTMERDAFKALVAQSLATTQNFDRVIQERMGTPAPRTEN